MLLLLLFDVVCRAVGGRGGEEASNGQGKADTRCAVSSFTLIANRSVVGDSGLSYSVSCDVAVQRCIFEKCMSSIAGGALSVQCNKLLVTDCQFSFCNSKISGGGVLAIVFSGDFFRNCFLACSADKRGSCIYADSDNSMSFSLTTAFAMDQPIIRLGIESICLRCTSTQSSNMNVSLHSASLSHSIAAGMSISCSAFYSLLYSTFKDNSGYSVISSDGGSSNKLENLNFIRNTAMKGLLRISNSLKTGVVSCVFLGNVGVMVHVENSTQYLLYCLSNITMQVFNDRSDVLKGNSHVSRIPMLHLSFGACVNNDYLQNFKSDSKQSVKLLVNVSLVFLILLCFVLKQSSEEEEEEVPIVEDPGFEMVMTDDD